jgi:putative ABC transport system substrate-binding protein
MRRRRVLLVLAGLTANALGARLARAADSAQGVVRLGLVGMEAPSNAPRAVSAFWQRLHELGWIEGQNLIIEQRWAEGHLDRLPALMAEVLGQKVDVLVTWTTPGAIAAKNATSTVPIVAVSMGDPIRSGLATSLARPGGNLTGLSVAYVGGIAGKWLELLQETVPHLSTIAVTANPDISVHRDQAKELEVIAATKGLKVLIIEVHTPEALDSVFEQAGRKAQALIVFADPITVMNRTRVTMLVAKHRLPAMYGLLDFVYSGGLMAYAPDLAVMFRRAADYVDKILKGAKPTDIPIEQPTQYLLVVNLKTAKALGLTIPESILLQANEVIR